MIDHVVEYWNDALTLLLASVTILIGYYQVQHYRAQRASLSFCSVDKAEYDRLNTSITRYEMKIRIENTGREPTTISDGTLEVSGEELELERFEGSIKVPLVGNGSPNLPSKVESEVRVPGNDVLNLKYRASGSRRKDYSEPVQGVMRIRTVGGELVEESVMFYPRNQ
ncbi:hypothetical protein [Haloterrigena salifodinae]|uniref:hypothetical protein n=1 Tax=Haloterrigena salifodinae TaxID=2675099 RepID=UPI000F887DFF|nr:hypothetical protein [Haloterrigena salifodinae]